MGHKREKKKKKKRKLARDFLRRSACFNWKGRQNGRICKSWYLEDHLKGPEYKQGEEKVGG